MQSLKNENPSQQYEIPATRRSDGSWRKARRVRPGFVPQEEVPLYTPKGKRVAQANPFPPGWHPDTSKSSTKQPQQQQQRNNTATVKKEPSATVTATKSQPAPIRVMTKVEDVTKIDDLNDTMQNSLKIRDDVVELSKRLKRLRRRLRELELLDEKIKSGEIVKPQKDQLEKITRRFEIEKEIEELEKNREDLKAQGFKQVDDDS
ncbi:partner of Y14 and mago [Chironomus tepperi]|uniref:partner of Y14 and mago n=1 Tax=Chironomus tepperi TaxID=113505 RepID=UPI00391F6B44